MEFFADYHTHTVYSDGGGTIEENARAAKEKGLEVLGITDHGPANIGVGVKNADTYLEIKEEIEAVRLKIPELKILCGAEANITGLDGAIDIPDNIVKKLDFLIVGLHPFVWGKSPADFLSIVAGNQLAPVSQSIRKKVKVNNTKALIECIHKHKVFCISHPGLKMPVDIEELSRHCAARDTALEINTGHKYNKHDLVVKALPAGVNFVVNSDAHFPDTVGRLLDGRLVLDRFNVPVDRVTNAR
ncbi:PHP domain-containing protein [Thermincola ferriacetica]